MPTVDVAKIKIRRGSNTDRKLIILDSGELGYTIDTNRVYVGNGTLKGGSSVGTFNFNNLTRANISVKNKAEVGDLVFDNYILYSLSGSDPSLTASWMRLTPNVDGTTIQYNTDHQLEVLTSGIVTAGNGIDVTGDVVSIDFDNDANTAQMFIPGAGGAATAQLTVNPDGALTNDSHGAIDYKPAGTATGVNHHTEAVAPSQGTAAYGFFTPLSAQKLLFAPEWDHYTSTTGTTAEQIGGNRTMQVINDGTIQINSARLDMGAVVTQNAIQAQAVTKTTGQGAATTGSISAVDMMTPWNFFNREDIPGSILRTAIPAANIDNKGEYANFTITNVGAGPTQWEDRAFLLPGGNGVIYGIFIESTSSIYDDIIETYPMVNWSSATYSATGNTIRANIIGIINSITNTNGERIFDAWQKLDLSDSTVYIQGLVKGKTPSWTAGSPADSFAQSGLDAALYRVGQTPAVIFSNTATSIDYTGTVGNNAGNGTTGKVGVGMYGWVCMNTQGSNTFQETLCSTGMFAKHTIAQFPETTTPELTNGEYFLIYDANYNRHCVWYRYPEFATELIPDISNNEIHRGRKTNFIKVEVDAGRTSDQVASMTYDALLANSEFVGVYTPTWSTPTLTLESSIVGWTDGIIKRQGNFPGCNVPAATPIQFISNITGLSGEPNVQSLNAAFYNSWQTGSTGTDLPTNGQIFIPQVGADTITVFETNGISSSTTVGTLLKFR
jgi:hypothetical protein